MPRPFAACQRGVKTLPLAAFISVAFVLKYVHETKGIKLEQMEG